MTGRWTGGALVALLVAVAGAAPLDAQKGDAGEEPTVRPTAFARAGPAFAGTDEPPLIGTAGVGLEVPFTRRFGLRVEGEVLLSLENGEGAFAVAPGAVLFLGDEAPDGASIRAGPAVWTGIGDEFSDPQVIGVFVAPSFPLGEEGARIETSVTGLVFPALLVEVGIGGVFR